MQFDIKDTACAKVKLFYFRSIAVITHCYLLSILMHFNLECFHNDLVAF